MTKQGLIDALAHRHKLTKAATEKLVEDLFKTVMNAAIDGGFRYPRFGTFAPRIRAAHKVPNHKQPGQMLEVPARPTIGFRPSKNMKDVVAYAASVVKRGAP